MRRRDLLLGRQAERIKLNKKHALYFYILQSKIFKLETKSMQMFGNLFSFINMLSITITSYENSRIKALQIETVYHFIKNKIKILQYVHLLNCVDLY